MCTDPVPLLVCDGISRVIQSLSHFGITPTLPPFCWHGTRRADMNCTSATAVLAMRAALVDRGTRMIVEELGLTYSKAKALLLMHGSVKKAVDAYKGQSPPTP